MASKCPFCMQPLPEGVYDETTHKTDITEMTKHMWDCGARATDAEGNGYGE